MHRWDPEHNYNIQHALGATQSNQGTVNKVDVAVFEGQIRDLI